MLEVRIAVIGYGSVGKKLRKVFANADREVVIGLREAQDDLPYPSSGIAVSSGLRMQLLLFGHVLAEQTIRVPEMLHQRYVWAVIS